MSTPEDLTERIKAKAFALGFDACGIARAEYLEEDAMRLEKWLQAEYHGKMGYMENHREKRTDPRKLVKGAQSVVSVIMNYFPRRSRTPSNEGIPVLSKYAYGTDYHFVIKDRLKELLNFIREEAPGTTGRPFVDSAPVLDRAWAVKAGLGWIGKNANLIHPVIGSFVFIGELIIDLPLKYNTETVKDYCGNCRKCIDACPTTAIISPRQIDGTKCLSYQTIELHDEIDSEIKPHLHERAFGCDICQDVCPWNSSAKPHEIKELEASDDLLNLSAGDWYNMEKQTFKKVFKNSAVQRAGYKKLKMTLNTLQENQNDQQADS